MTRHNLKLNDKYFESIITEKKTFEIRNNDRDFHIGDILEFVRTDDKGKEIVNNVGMRDYCMCTVEYILTSQEFPDGLKDGYVILGIKRL